VDGRDKPGHDGIDGFPAIFLRNAFDSNLSEIIDSHLNEILISID
jgi:hypothetical protein